MTRGILYIATKEPYLSEAEQSARSLREHHPDIPVTIVIGPGLDPDESLFDTVIIRSNNSHDFEDSLLGPEDLVYDKTLMLDSDTYVCHPIDDVFDMLDDFDLAAAHSASRDGSVSHDHDHDVPDGWPQFNTGVLAYRDNDRVRELFTRWRAVHEEIRELLAANLNQPAFRIATYEWEGRIATLPPEYNFRPYYGLAYANNPVRIVHLRDNWVEPAELAEEMNAYTGPRVVTFEDYPCRLITDEEPAIRNRVLAGKATWKTTKDGYLPLLKWGVDRVKRTVVHQ